MGGTGEGGGGGCCIRGRFLPPALGLVNKLPAAMIGRPSGSCGTGESASVEFHQISYRRCLYEITHSAQISISSSVMASGAHIEVVAENPGSVFFSALSFSLLPDSAANGETLAGEAPVTRGVAIGSGEGANSLIDLKPWRVTPR